MSRAISFELLINTISYLPNIKRQFKLPRLFDDTQFFGSVNFNIVGWPKKFFFTFFTDTAHY